MTTLSVILPDALAKASQEAAMNLGISRTQFIRRAIAHELEKYQAELEEQAIIKSFSVMKTNKQYLKDAEKIESGFGTTLPSEEDNWWNKKKS